METVIKNNQADYYEALGKCDKAGEATLFIDFMLQALLSATAEISSTDQVTDQVKALVKELANGEASGAELMKRLALSHKPTFRRNYLAPALESGWIERSAPIRPEALVSGIA